MCNLPTIFAIILYAKMFLKMLMVMREKQRGGIQMEGIHMLKVSKWM
jgi:hypothetical protein